MAIEFPSSCRLSEAEKGLLSNILGKRESPCSDCMWQSECDGSRESLNLLQNIIDNFGTRCLICGENTSNGTRSKIIDGVFRSCSKNSDEFVFTAGSRSEEVFDDVPF